MRISDWSSDVCSSDLRAHHFALDASHTRSGAPRDLGVAQVIDPVREEHIACEPGKREKCRLSAGEQFGGDGFVTVCNACVRKLVAIMHCASPPISDTDGRLRDAPGRAAHA